MPTYFSNLKINTFEFDVFDIFLGMFDDKLANLCWSFFSFWSNSFVLNDTRFLETLVVESLAIVSNLRMPKWIGILCLGYQNLKFIKIMKSILLETLFVLSWWDFFIEVDRTIAFFLTLRASCPTLDSLCVLVFWSKCATIGAIMSFPKDFNVVLIFDSLFDIFSTIFVNWNVDCPPILFLRTYFGCVNKKCETKICYIWNFI